MFYRQATALVAFAGLIVSTVPTAAMTGIGCPDLPEYYRALGTIENGEGSCGMTTAEANRILARQSSPDAPVAPARPKRHRKHHYRAAPAQ